MEYIWVPVASGLIAYGIRKAWLIWSSVRDDWKQSKRSGH